MSIKRYCDICGEQMDQHQPQLLFTLQTWTDKRVDARQCEIKLEVRAMRAVNGAWNGGDVCISCIRKAVEEGDVGTFLEGGV